MSYSYPEEVLDSTFIDTAGDYLEKWFRTRRGKMTHKDIQISCIQFLVACGVDATTPSNADQISVILTKKRLRLDILHHKAAIPASFMTAYCLYVFYMLYVHVVVATRAQTAVRGIKQFNAFVKSLMESLTSHTSSQGIRRGPVVRRIDTDLRAMHVPANVLRVAPSPLLIPKETLKLIPRVLEDVVAKALSVVACYVVFGGGGGGSARVSKKFDRLACDMMMQLITIPHSGGGQHGGGGGNSDRPVIIKAGNTEGRCGQIMTIPQFTGTCLFNAVLMAIFYSEGMNKILLEKLSDANLTNFGQPQNVINVCDKVTGMCKSINYNYNSKKYWFTGLENVSKQFKTLEIKDMYISLLASYHQDTKTNKKTKEKIRKYLYKFAPDVILKYLHNLNAAKFPYNPIKENGGVSYEYAYNLLRTLQDLDGVDFKIAAFDYVEDGGVLKNSISMQYDNVFNEPYSKQYDVILITKEGATRYVGHQYNPPITKGFKLSEEINFGGFSYKVDSVILTDIALLQCKETDIGHAIAGVSCGNDRYIYNGWTQKYNDEERISSCPLFKYDWMKQDSNYFSIGNDCTLVEPHPISKLREGDGKDKLAYGNHNFTAYLYIKHKKIDVAIPVEEPLPASLQAMATAFYYCNHDNENKDELFSTFKAVIINFMTESKVDLDICYAQYVWLFYHIQTNYSAFKGILRAYKIDKKLASVMVRVVLFCKSNNIIVDINDIISEIEPFKDDSLLKRLTQDWNYETHKVKDELSGHISLHSKDNCNSRHIGQEAVLYGKFEEDNNRMHKQKTYSKISHFLWRFNHLQKNELLKIFRVLIAFEALEYSFVYFVELVGAVHNSKIIQNSTKENGYKNIIILLKLYLDNTLVLKDKTYDECNKFIEKQEITNKEGIELLFYNQLHNLRSAQLHQVVNAGANLVNSSVEQLSNAIHTGEQFRLLRNSNVDRLKNDNNKKILVNLDSDISIDNNLTPESFINAINGFIENTRDFGAVNVKVNEIDGYGTISFTINGKTCNYVKIIKINKYNEWGNIKKYYAYYYIQLITQLISDCFFLKTDITQIVDTFNSHISSIFDRESTSNPRTLDKISLERNVLNKLNSSISWENGKQIRLIDQEDYLTIDEQYQDIVVDAILIYNICNEIPLRFRGNTRVS